MRSARGKNNNNKNLCNAQPLHSWSDSSTGEHCCIMSLNKKCEHFVSQSRSASVSETNVDKLFVARADELALLPAAACLPGLVGRCVCVCVEGCGGKRGFAKTHPSVSFPQCELFIDPLPPQCSLPLAAHIYGGCGSPAFRACSNVTL